jgi:hypothetical protein
MPPLISRSVWHDEVRSPVGSPEYLSDVSVGRFSLKLGRAKTEPTDPSRHVTDVKHPWTELREHGGVACRLHDLRHTFATELAERGVPESTMLALMGHMSKAVLERYSQIRMAAKRNAVAGISLRRETVNSEVVPVKVPVVVPSATIQ